MDAEARAPARLAPAESPRSLPNRLLARRSGRIPGHPSAPARAADSSRMHSRAPAGRSEKPYPGSDGTTTSNASSVRPPYRSGSVRRGISSSISKTEPGHPWVTISGSGRGPRPRSWMKWTRPLTRASARNCENRLSRSSTARQSKPLRQYSTRSRRSRRSIPVSPFVAGAGRASASVAGAHPGRRAVSARPEPQTARRTRSHVAARSRGGAPKPPPWAQAGCLQGRHEVGAACAARGRRCPWACPSWYNQ